MAGTYLTGGTFNGSAPTTFSVDATSANSASKVVARDASGNFSAGTITANAFAGGTVSATTGTFSNKLTLTYTGGTPAEAINAAWTASSNWKISGVWYSTVGPSGTAPDGALWIVY
jgi:hypothetical protein